MGVYIKGMEMPKEDEEIIIRIDSFGTVMTEYALPISGAKAIPVQPHGRLVDMDTIEERIDSCCDDIDCTKTMCNKCAVQIVMDKVFDAPTIIPAEEE